MLEVLREQENNSDSKAGWDRTFEEAFISFLIHSPERFVHAMEHFTPNLFESFTCQFVAAQIAHDYKAFGVIPSRDILRDRLAKQLTVEDPWEEILGLVKREPDLREIPFVMAEWKRFVGNRILKQLTSDEMLELMVGQDAQLIADRVGAINAEFDRFCRGETRDSFSAVELLETFPDQRAAVIDGFLREGQIANVVSSSKVGKSWLMYGLALSVTSGRPWFGHSTQQGNVLLVDNELQPEDLSFRLRCVSREMGVPLTDLDVWTLRDAPKSLSELRPRLEKLEPGQYGLIILDAKYKFVEADASENDNADEARFYAMLSEIAGATKAAIALVHHSTKGDQTEKRITDVGSGAGAQSRAADCHIILRDHEDEGKVVLDAAIRSFKPVQPQVLHFQYPLWRLDEQADPARLATKQARDQKNRDQEGCGQILSYLREQGAATSSKLRALGIGPDRLARLLNQLVAAGTITATQIKVRGNSTYEYQVKEYVVGTLSAEEINRQH